ncbi:hypothetical protein HYQ45_008284 [Verticillium longisporum]|uniref:Uncharacterized protein n=1 Tax=Verticillium longisporum TaxID=100787 RepID=A0A8I2ZNQ0_VERLO|nr:hypothetical protein HYQ45_008284 [Verticillium longisporum]
MLSRKFHTHPVTKHWGQRLVLTKHAAQTNSKTLRAPTCTEIFRATNSTRASKHLCTTTSTSSSFYINIEAHRSRKRHHTIQGQESRACSRQRTYPSTFGWPSYARCADSHAT